MELFDFLSIKSPVFSLFLFLTLSWISKKILRKYYIHKISTPPPPPEAGGSWPAIGHIHLLTGSKPAYKTLNDMADKRGPIFTVKLGVHRVLIISSWEMAKECFTTNDKIFANRPKTIAMDILGYNFAMLGFSPYGHHWRQARKVSTLELLSNHRLEKLRYVRESEIRECFRELYESCVNDKNGFVDMKKWFSDVTLNVILKMVVGERFTTSSFGENKEWRKALHDLFDLSGRFVLSDALPYLRWFDITGEEKFMRKTMKELDLIAEVWLEKHKRKRLSGKTNVDEDFMDVLISILEREPDQFPDYDADTIYKALSLTLILAASDTTTVTLTWTLSLLLNNPDALKKLQQELESKIGRERRVEESDVKDLIYLEAVLKESLRLYPPAPLSLPHQSMEDCTVNGYHVPAGTQLFVNVARIQRDERVWSDPNEFKPERFLTTNKDVDVRGNHFELIPFGSGRRMCPGIYFAFQVVKLTLANLLHGFDLEPRSYPIDMEEGAGLTNLKASPLEVCLIPRLYSHLNG